MSSDLYTFVIGPLLSWLVGISLLLVGYLASLKIRDIRRDRRMNQERERLGLRRPYRPAASWLLF